MVVSIICQIFNHLYTSLSLLVSGLVMCLALANGTFGGYDANEGMNQVGGVGHIFLCISQYHVKSFIPNSFCAFSLGLRINPCREMLRHSKETSPAHNLKQNHSAEPGQSTVDLQAMNMRINTHYCNWALLQSIIGVANWYRTWSSERLKFFPSIAQLISI